MFHRFYCYAQHHRESTHTSYLDQILNEHFNHPVCGRRTLDCLPSKLSIIGGHVSVVNTFAKNKFFRNVLSTSGAGDSTPDSPDVNVFRRTYLSRSVELAGECLKSRFDKCQSSEICLYGMLVRTFMSFDVRADVVFSSWQLGCDYSSHSACNLPEPSAALATGSDM